MDLQLVWVIVFLEKSVTISYSFLTMTQNLISKAISIVGIYRLGKACGIAYQSIYRWERNGRLPRTEWTGETNYAAIIEAETHGQITREQLLNFKRSGETDAGKPHQNQA